MAISSVSTSQTSAYTQQSSGAAAAQNVSSSGSAASRQIDKQAESSRVKLSAVGQVSAGLSNVRDSASALKNAKTTGNVADATKAVDGFVKAFNNQNSTVNKLTSKGTTAQQDGTLAKESSVRAAQTDVNSSAAGDSKSKDALSKIGVTVQSDGSLKLDKAAFEKAYKADPKGTQDALSKLGDRTESAANRQLSSKGGVGSAENKAKVIASATEQRQQALQSQRDAAQNAINSAQQSGSAIAGLVASQVASYQKVFSL